MFETLFKLPAVVERHRAAPLAPEREQFLAALQRQGATSRPLLIAYAAVLIQIVRFLRLQELRNVKLSEIKTAARRWASYRGKYRQNDAGPWSEPYFTWVARRWLRFHGRLILPSGPRPAFADRLEEFAESMKSVQGLSPVTISGRTWQTADFLTWLSKVHRRLFAVSLNDVDEYLAAHARKWTKVTLATRASTLRAFFRYAESRHWCMAGIAGGIKGPPLPSGPLAGQGPKWDEVVRLLRATRGTKPATVRAKAILLLFAFYGLRSSEVTGLLLNDFDWQNRTFTVRRSKRGGLQQFPIQPELGAAILRYFRLARPKCSCRHLFVSLLPPYRPVHAASLWKVVSLWMRRLGIRSRHMGPHCLRHACATHLLEQGAPLREIADFLGHHNCQTVGIYAKFDTAGLRSIADLDLTSAV